MHRRPFYGPLWRAAAGGQMPGQGPQSFAQFLAARRPPAVTSPVSGSPPAAAPPGPAPQSAALATAVAAQQGAAAPTNGSSAAPPIPPPVPAMAPAAAPPRAYPMPAAAGAAPVSGFWGGRQDGQDFVTVTQPGVAQPAPAAAPPAPAAPQNAFQAAAAQYTDDAMNQGVMVDTSAWTPADFQAAAAATGNYAPVNPIPGSMQANIWASSQVSQARHPVDPAAQARQTAENNALRAARTAAMGQLVSGPMSTPVSNPAEVAARFDQSGYTGAQALADGWGTGTGRAGWEALPGWTAPLNAQGLMGAPYVNQGAVAPATAAASAAPASPAAPPAPASDPYAPPGYTPGVAAQPPAPGPITAMPQAGPRPTAWSPPATTAPPPQSPALSTTKPERPAPMPKYSSYFGGLGKAAGGGL